MPITADIVDPEVLGRVTTILPSEDTGFSTRQESVVDFGPSNGNKTVSLEVFFFQNIDGIQTYLEDKDNRVLCADLLARGFNICLLDIDLISYDNVTPNASVASTSIKEYLGSLSSGQPFVMSDMVSNLPLVS